MSPAAPTLSRERCLNARNRAAACDRCAVACPVPSAIRLETGLPVLDATACARCGTCLHVCPGDAYVGDDRPNVDLARAVGSAVGTHIAVVCHRHPAPDRAAPPVEAVVRYPRCLAGVPPSRLLSLAEQRDLWLDDTPCARCELGAAGTTVARSVGLAESLRRAGRRSGSVQLVSRSGAGPRRPVRVIDAAAPPLPRRALFTGLVAHVRSYRDPVPAADQPPVTRSGRHLSIERRRLLHTLGDWTTAAGDAGRASGYDLVTVVVRESACSACGLCDRVCPTGALRLEAADGAYRLARVSAACVACRLCVVLCPEGSVTLKPGVGLEELLWPREERLAGGDLTACAGCGAAVAARDGVDGVLCHVCRQSGGPTRHGHDTAGLMDDLLRRSGFEPAAIRAGVEMIRNGDAMSRQAPTSTTSACTARAERRTGETPLPVGLERRS